MARRLVRGAIAAIGRITGNMLPRPLNLVVFPAPLELDSGSAVVVYGRDAPEAVAGCGGLLALHSAAGGESLVIIEEAVTDRELAAVGKLGGAMRTPELYCRKQDGNRAIPRRAILFYPFPLSVEEEPVIEELERNQHAGIFYYQSRMLMLPEYQLRVDRAIRSKLLALHALGCTGELRLSAAAMAYGSSMVGGGRGWFESFMTCDEREEASGRFVFHGE